MRQAKILFDESIALEIYQTGANDTTIAGILGVQWQHITKWRGRNNLPSNLKRRKPHEKI